MTFGLVCDACDALSPVSAVSCEKCGASLGIAPRATPAGNACNHCGGSLTPGNRFCGKCGKPILQPAQPQAAKVKPGATMFFGAMQAPGRAKLILIKGDGMDGVSYVLSATDHIAGRDEGEIVFPEDPFLSPRHANFVYQEGKLHVRDEGSENGVFVRILRPNTMPSGTFFLIGEQLLRIDSCPPETPAQPEADGTYYYASPGRPAKMTLTQILAGGHRGLVVRSGGPTLSFGREGNDINFPEDPFISGRHAQIQLLDGDRFQLSDLGSKNGTFVRVHKETPLYHGDYVFMGQQLVRVEIT